MSKEEAVTIRLPKLGESIVSATVVQWLKKEGQPIAEDEPLLEVATDKVNSEIPSPVAGIVKKLLVEVDQTIDIGAPLATVRPIGEVDLEAEATTEPEYHSHTEHHEATKGFISPAVLRLVRERGVPLDELEHIKGTGLGGRITKKDVENYIVARWDKSKGKGEERVAMSPMRKAIADNMTRSFYTAPHAYLVSEIDVTELMGAIKAHKESFLEKHGFKLTITAFIVKAIAQAVDACPLVNASLEEDTMILKKEVNVGVAVAVEDGLIVPVIKQCGEKSVIDIAGAITDLSIRTRKSQLKPDEVSGGTITLTNFGMSGALLGLPIIRYPEVAIVGVGAIQERLTPDGVRRILNATLSFDHRAVDGMYAGLFVKALKESLEAMHTGKPFN
jgi:2-oxoglutarate dehydrogenase E2 component (dihydrolipoamide succinyltransferase)